MILPKLDMETTNKMLEEFLKRQEERSWKKEKRFEDFLEFLINIVETERSVLSDSFHFKEELCSPYSSNEFEQYLFSLFTFTSNYCEKNFISNRFETTEEDCFTEESFCIKIKENYYKIELVSGQGSYICFQKVKYNYDYPFAIYEEMIDNKQSSNYNLNIKCLIFNELDNLVNDLVQQDISLNTINKCVKEYMRKIRRIKHEKN